MYAPTMNRETCAHVDCWRPADLGVRFPDGRGGIVIIGYCRPHGMRYDGHQEPERAA
jgi:hypothetical protein